MGISNPMPAAGPMPGSMPMMVPIRQPRNVYHRLIGISATSKPCRMWPTVSIAFFLETQNADGQHDTQHFDEQQITADRKQNRSQRIGNPLAAVEYRHHHEQIYRGGNKIAG